MSDRRALKPGFLVLDYEVLSVLGMGAFGITYLVKDRQLGRRFALKEYCPDAAVLRAQDGSISARRENRADFEAGLRRFLREGQTLASLEHPNVATVVRHFEANGTAYLLMSYYEGRSLYELLKQGGTFTPDEIDALLTPLMSALSYLHAQGVTHGDIKPANLYITRQGTPIILDFGAARVAHAKAGEGGATHGSEGYAAPEQSGLGGKVGPKTDIYGLAASLYRLVTGRLPPPSTERWGVMEAGGKDPLAPLSSRADVDFSDRFMAAVESGLAVRPADRPGSILEWQSGLQPVARTARTGGKKPLQVEREGSWWPPVLGAAVILGLLGLAAWLVMEGAGEPDDQPRYEVTEGRPATALSSDDESWEQALRVDTAAAFRAYLAQFPRGRQATAAQEQLARFDRLAWERAQNPGSLEQLERYLDSFPDGKFVVEAQARAAVLQAVRDQEQSRRLAENEKDNAAFREARSAGTIQALDDYLGAFPGGINVAEAFELKAAIERNERDRDAWAIARERHRKDGYERYLRAFPEGLHLVEAMAALEALTLRPGKVFRDCADCPLMVVVPPGGFEQGSSKDEKGARSNEMPPRMVRIAKPFAMGVHEVTFTQWDLCAQEGACRAQAVDNGWGRGERPVMLVSWADAQAFVSWLSERSGEVYTLPSESQWEYVARAGQSGPWIGGVPGQVCQHGNVAALETPFRWRHDGCSDPYSVGTAEVGYFEPNSFGVYDMIGNVAEWTLDCMNLSYIDAPADGSSWERGLCSSRVTRGGSWFSGAREIRLPARFTLKTGESNDFTGIRVVREVTE